MAFTSDTGKTSLLVAIVTAVICLLIYLPVLQYGFINFDDPEYVLHNPVISQLGRDNLVQMFFHTHIGWWMPLTWLSLAIDYRIWGENPFGFHLTNILLHAVNAGIVVLIVDRLLKKRRGAKSDEENGAAGGSYYYAAVLLFAGLLFSVHPLRIESVAWVAERKDVLNGLFTFASILFYLQFVEWKDQEGATRCANLFYSLSLLCFGCSLMAKSVSVVLPAMLIVLDWVPLERLPKYSLTRLILEKWPFWAASLLMAFFTLFFATQSQYLVTYEAFPFVQRVLVSGNAIWEYCRMLFFPVGLSPFNVIPDPVPFAYTVKTVLVAMALSWLIIVGQRKVPLLTACAFCFLLPLLPVLAFFQNGDQSFADRFTYLPALAPTIFLGFCLYPGVSRAPVRRLAVGAGAVLLAVYIAVAVRQMGVWKNSETFWTRIVEVEPLAITYKERGKYYHSIGRYAEAAADFSAALGIVPLTLKPYEYNFYALRGESLRAAGQYAEAVRDFTTAIGMRSYPAYLFHRGLALKALGRAAEADEDFRRAGPNPGPVAWFD